MYSSPRASGAGASGSAGGVAQLGSGTPDGLTDDVLHVVDVDAQSTADVDRPDLGAQVRLEVELAADVGPRRLTVLAHHDEGREEDRFEADDHREEAEGELVEYDRPADEPHVEQDPQPEPDRVEIDEVERPGEGGDAVGGAVLGPFDRIDERALVADASEEDREQVSVLDAVGLVDGAAGGTAERCVGGRGVGHALQCALAPPVSSGAS